MLGLLSVFGFVLMVAGLLGLIVTRSLFSFNPLVITVQTAAVVLMVWARITLGHRSFHATAAPTEGALITNGPYRYIRHPIYTAVCLFTCAGALAHPSFAALLVILVLIGAVARMFAEEKLLRARYPGYKAYAAATKRMVPFVF
ncbi:MAG: methyltransferase [Candidatus Zixiibacteriota bacterium]